MELVGEYWDQWKRVHERWKADMVDCRDELERLLNKRLKRNSDSEKVQTLKNQLDRWMELKKVLWSPQYQLKTDKSWVHEIKTGWVGKPEAALGLEYPWFLEVSSGS